MEVDNSQTGIAATSVTDGAAVLSDQSPAASNAVCQECGADEPMACESISLKSEKTSAEAADSQARKTCKLNTPPAAERPNINCLLIEDTSPQCAPLQLRLLLEQCNDQSMSQGELLMLLVYVLALESGFCAQKLCSSCSLDQIDKVPPSTSFHSKNVVRLSAALPKFDHDVNKVRFSLKLRSLIDLQTDQPTTLHSLLTGIISGDFLIVTLTPEHTTAERGHSLCLSIARYILRNRPRDKPPHQRFSKLGELSHKLREGLFHPVRSQQLALLDVQLHPSLLGLPPELYDNIFQYLSKNQLRIVSNVCLQLYHSTMRSKVHQKGKLSRLYRR